MAFGKSGLVNGLSVVGFQDVGHSLRTTKNCQCGRGVPNICRAKSHLHDHMTVTSLQTPVPLHINELTSFFLILHLWYFRVVEPGSKPVIVQAPYKLGELRFAVLHVSLFLHYQGSHRTANGSCVEHGSPIHHCQ